MSSLALAVSGGRRMCGVQGRGGIMTRIAVPLVIQRGEWLTADSYCMFPVGDVDSVTGAVEMCGRTAETVILGPAPLPLRNLCREHGQQEHKAGGELIGCWMRAGWAGKGEAAL
jgi:hypothetical protein